MDGDGETKGYGNEEQSREKIIGTGIAMSSGKLKLVKHSTVVVRMPQRSLASFIIITAATAL